MVFKTEEQEINFWRNEYKDTFTKLEHLKSNYESMQQTNDVLIKRLKEIEKTMSNILVKDAKYENVGINYRPIKNTTKEDCYEALNKISEILSGRL